MAKNRPCCGHEHYRDDEVWLSVDEFIDLVRMTVQHMLADPDAQLPAAEREQIRARLEQRRAAGRQGAGNL